MKRLACIVGARPNFMKIAPILRAFRNYEDVQPVLIHTGQHYDQALSDIFFQELQIPHPDISLAIGSGSHAQQTANILVAIERLLIEKLDAGLGFDRMVVVGDVNSTLAATLAAAKLRVPVAHVEAGLRSFDRAMPEEINRLVTDALSDLWLCSEPTGVQHLIAEGKPKSSIHLVGNVMIDTLLSQLDVARSRDTLKHYDVIPGNYNVVTLHRPSNVDSKLALSELTDVLIRSARTLPIVFPVHPRTRLKLNEFELLSKLESDRNIRLTNPLGYHDFLCLTSQAKVIVTDSGGLQEESTALGIPCLTMRENTERPITVEMGTSTLIGNDAEMLDYYLQQVICDKYKQGKCPEFWDGKAALRIVHLVAECT
ncbi:MAG: UDP-N-acetylglucosamine 2-epimerase (non-hydrolyzing) [Planctomycetales bacterium]|nr:UDP-N-acetylglucosamine 2-epimerase (non-hydrolyzing) [Planctomycetales bacterium]